MTTMQDWVAGARPRTLWTAVTPVAVGTACAIAVDGFHLLIALLALGVALSLQIASNYANDYSDGVRGTDMDRVGPDRLVASGKALPSSVKRAAFLMFGVGALLGLWLVIVAGQWWWLIVGALAIAAAWTYTGSSRPYGYDGWGEVSVFVFFGLVAVLGTMVAQAAQITWWAVVAAAGVGFTSVAMLMVNNIRDIETDALTGKRTLAVKLGPQRARHAFLGVMMAPVACALLVSFAHPWALLATIMALPSLLIGLAVRGPFEGRALAPIFMATSGVGLGYGVLLAVGIAL
ncbi:1,4-dihydroxy-2-naphthoate polyprenyltransferase [Demequina capsici]|uniref:1,4-dihydroxy-2-naphthoate octaprenyltransferase n=1 Tax=Demequina capsici TaxID=3075620 RepID=A0AA96JFP8_9MICO|nr:MULTISPECIES: 1,4-dihydroxy-2-naphthoate polyprenyltransferase [unclassified Demequina]WNM24185.1 1,4-dihydroxy-2-naphthoate polyprenyltransferase [Demequina sp. OYTSA14]WNM27014.1 1,4-dihydroxy-2-naphthoate polyprenyltransferase [Demequina sp. PMTSA13]